MGRWRIFRRYELSPLRGVARIREGHARLIRGNVQDIEQGFDRFGNRIEQGFDDVVDAPEEIANWAGRKVGDVERFDDNVDDAYDEGKYEGRNDDRW